MAGFTRVSPIIVSTGTLGPSYDERLNLAESGIGDAASAPQDYTPLRGGSSLTIWSKPQRIDPHASTYGAVGDGVTNDYTALNAAYARAQALGAFVDLASADYKLNTPLDVSRAPTIGRGRGRTRFIQGSSSGVLQIAGTEGAVAATLTSNAARFAETIALSTVSGLAVGDWLLIGSGASFSTARPAQLVGEMVQIKSIASLNVTLVNPLRDSYLTADTAGVRKLTLKTGARMEGFTVENLAPDTRTGSGLYAFGCRDLQIADVGMAGLDGEGFGLYLCSGVTIDDPWLYNLTDNPDNSRYGYGISANRGAEFVNINGGVAHGCRHVVTTDGTDASWGVPRSVTVTGMVSRNAKASAYDSHPHGEDIHFVGCDAFGARDFAFHHRAKHSSVKACAAADCRGGAYLEVDSLQSEVRSTTFTRMGWIAGRPTDGSTAFDAADAAITLSGPGQKVQECNIEGVVGQAIVVNNPRAIVQRNTIKESNLNNASAYVIEIKGSATNPTVRDNSYFTDSSLAAVAGFVRTTTPSVFVRVSTTTTGTVIDNKTYGSSITPLEATSAFVGARSGNVRADEGSPIQVKPFAVMHASAGLKAGTATAGTHANGLAYLEFADAATQNALGAAPVGYDAPFNVGGSFTVLIRWSSPAITGNVRWRVMGSLIAANGDVTAVPATTTTFTETVSGTANGEKVTQLDFGSALRPVANRLLLLDVARLGADAADTCTGVARVHQVQAYYDRA